MNRENLKTLADYLKTLPPAGFNMRVYARTEHDEPLAPVHMKYPHCGTVACAAGHGPAAGIPPLAWENWDEYVDRVFKLSEFEWTWCFSTSWAGIDDTPAGAADRILTLLESGIPEDGLARLEEGDNQ